tara:strand:- start:4796 stop:5440 length:645 start_codon:yes stop_codon:yes gene_type:complete
MTPKNKDNFLKNTVNIILLLFTITFVLVYFIEPSYEFDEDELRDDVWQLEEILEDVVTVAVNGKIVYGDRYRVWFYPNNEADCQLAHSTISFLSVTDNATEKFDNLPSDTLSAKINNEEILFNITSASDFLGTAKNVYIDIGVMTADDLLSYFSNYDEIEIELTGFYDSDNEEKLNDEIADYFEFPRNIYSTTGFEKAITLGQANCLALVNEES